VNAPAKLGLRAAELCQGVGEHGGEFRQVVGAAVGEGVVQLVPDPLIRIELGRIGGEALEVQPGIGAAEVADRVAFVRFPVVPDDNDAATKMPEEMAQELADFWLLDILGVPLEVEPEALAARADGEGRDRGELVVLVAVRGAGSFPARPPGAADWRNQEEA